MERPPEPIPVVLPPHLPMPKLKQSKHRALPTKPGVREEKYVYNTIPEEGFPYDWRTNKELTDNEAAQMIRAIWQGGKQGGAHWDTIGLARRFNLRPMQVRKILELADNIPDWQKNGLDYTPRGPINADSLPNAKEAKKQNG